MRMFYHMLYLVIRYVHITRDIIWPRQMFFQKCFEEDYGWMPQEIEMSTIEL